MSELTPKYTIWEGLNVAIHVGMRALEEIRTLARIPGPAGRDGVSYDGIEEEIKDGGRWLIRRHKLNGVVVCEQQFQLATILYRGVFKEGHTYLRGDTVAYGGSTFIAEEDTTDKPDDLGGKKSWTLMAKRGRDGKDFDPNNPPKPRGPVKVG